MKQLITLLLLLTSISLIAQSPWTKEKSEAYLQLSYTTISGYSELFGDPELTTEREINDNTLQLYTEYGLSDKTTLIASVPLKMVSSNGLVTATTTPFTTESTKTALGNIELGIKHNFINKKWLLSGQLNVELNTGSFDEASGLRTGYDAFTVTPLIITGRGFNNWYIQAFTGVAIRTNDYSSAYKLGGEVGYKALDWLWVAGFLDGVASFHNGDLNQTVTNTKTGLYVNDQSYGAFGLKLAGEIKDNFGLNVGFGGAFGGRNVAKKPAISFGVFYKIK